MFMKLSSDDCVSTNFMQSSTSRSGDNNGPTSQHNSTNLDSFGSGSRKLLRSLHCCYGWTEDWCWMMCIWTHSRGVTVDSLPSGVTTYSGLLCVSLTYLQNLHAQESKPM